MDFPRGGMQCASYLMYLVYLMVLRNPIGLTFLGRFNQVASFFLLLFPLSIGIGDYPLQHVDVDRVLKLVAQFLLICVYIFRPDGNLLHTLSAFFYNFSLYFPDSRNWDFRTFHDFAESTGSQTG